jgi:hypothetical protein
MQTARSVVSPVRRSSVTLTLHSKSHVHLRTARTCSFQVRVLKVFCSRPPLWPSVNSLNRQQTTEMKIKMSTSALTSHSLFHMTSPSILHGDAFTLPPQPRKHPRQYLAGPPVFGDKEFGESPNMVQSQYRILPSHPLQILSPFLFLLSSFLFFFLLYFSSFLLC